jgi:hypothetical protein
MSTTNKIKIDANKKGKGKVRFRNNVETPPIGGDKVKIVTPAETGSSGPIPNGWVFDRQAESVPLVHKSGVMRQYITSVFMDFMCEWMFSYTSINGVTYSMADIAHGHPPESRLLKAKDYTPIEGVPPFASKTAFGIYFSTGHRIVNYPLGCPLPSDIENADLSSPQSWTPSVYKRVLQQYGHPDPTRRLGIVCRSEGMVLFLQAR